MNAIMNLLQCPVCSAKLSLQHAGCICSNGHTFEATGNMINFVNQTDGRDKDVEKSASFRWDNSLRLEYDKAFQRHELSDFLKRYDFKDQIQFKELLKNKKVIAEIGAGEGRLVDFLLHFSNAHIFALELSDSAYYLREKYANNNRVTVLKCDAEKHPFKPSSVNLISCDQCIHHSKRPGAIFDSLSNALANNGSCLLSVYAKKSNVREKMDAIIRDQISALDNNEKLVIAEKITEISRMLSDIDLNIQVPKEFTEFGNLAGQDMPLQRFFYYAIFKCFWNENFTFEKCKEFNFDWYSYPICYKSSPEEAVQWFTRNNINIEHVDFNFSNINLRGTKK